MEWCGRSRGEHHSPLLVVCFWSFLLPQAGCALSHGNPYHMMMFMYSLWSWEGLQTERLPRWWCPTTGQRAVGINRSTVSSRGVWGRTLLWGLQSTGTGCSEMFWSLLFWTQPKATWMLSSVPCCRVPASAMGLDVVISRGPFQPLWFCRSKMEKILTFQLYSKRIWMIFGVWYLFSTDGLPLIQFICLSVTSKLDYTLLVSDCGHKLIILWPPPGPKVGETIKS